MGMFPALLVAAALGCEMVSAVPHRGYGSAPPPYAPANTTTSGHSHDVTIFAPHTQITQSSLIAPSYWNVSTTTSVPLESTRSPATGYTQSSLLGSNGTSTETPRPVPTLERTEDSLDVPTIGPHGPTLPPPLPTAQVEHSESSLKVPTRSTSSIDEGGASRAHTEQTQPALDLPGYGGESTFAFPATKATATELVPGGPTVAASAHLEVTKTALEVPTALPQNEGRPQGQPSWPTRPADIVASILGAKATQKTEKKQVPAHIGTYLVDSTPAVAGSSATTTGTKTPQTTGQDQAPAHIGTYFVDSTPVVAGSPATTIGGTAYSVAPSGNAVYMNGVSSSLSVPPGGSNVAAVIVGASEVAPVGAGSSASTAELQNLASQRIAAATGSGISTTSSVAASGISTATPAVQTTNVAAGLMLPGLGLGAVAFIAVFL